MYLATPTRSVVLDWVSFIKNGSVEYPLTDERAMELSVKVERLDDHVALNNYKQTDKVILLVVRLQLFGRVLPTVETFHGLKNLNLKCKFSVVDLFQKYTIKIKFFKVKFSVLCF